MRIVICKSTPQSPGLDADNRIALWIEVRTTAERVYGYKEGEWPEDQHVFETVHPDDRQRIFDLWEGSLSTPGEFRPLEIRLRKADGSWMYSEVIANNLKETPR